MRKLACAASLALLFAVSSTARADVTEQDFMIDTMGDLMALCGVDAADPNAVAVEDHARRPDLENGERANSVKNLLDLAHLLPILFG